MLSSSTRVRAVLARASTAALLAMMLIGGLAARAQADNGIALLEIGRLSDGTSTNVNPGTIVTGLDVNEGAGGKFGALAPNYPNGYGVFTFTPPPGTSITRSRIWPRLSAYGWPAMGTWTELTSSWGTWNINGNPGATDVNGLWAQGGAGVTTGAIASLTARATQASTGAGIPQTGYFYTDKLDITLSDAGAPSVDEAPADGLLFGPPNASGWYTAASLPVALKASDAGLGVRWLLIKDGTTVHKLALPGTGSSCATKDPSDTAHGGDVYTTKVPCPTATTSYTVDVDLRVLGDGVRSLQLGVMDAAGRSTYGAAYVTKINAPGRNAPPSGGTGLADPGSVGPGGCVLADDGMSCAFAGNGGGGGGGGGAGGAGGTTDVPRAGGPGAAATIATAATTPPPTPSPAPAVDDGRANGTNASPAAALDLQVNGQPTRRVSIAYGQTVVVTGHLTGRGGNPIAGANLTVVTVNGRASVPGQPVVTGADGAFRTVITPKASQTVRFAYRAFIDDGADADTAALEIGVRAVAHLKASPRALDNGQTVAFRGEVAGTPRGSDKVVEMQVHQDGRWLTFATTRLHGGHFSYRYRFTRTKTRTRYVFRTVVRTDAGWPYETGSSNHVSVVVRP